MSASRAGGRGALQHWPLLTLVLVTLLLHGHSARFDFVYADDVDLVRGNAGFLGDLSNLPGAFTRSYFDTGNVLTDLRTYYRPLAIASFMADTRAGGGRAAAFHITNVLLHTLVVVLLWLLLRRLGAARGAAVALALVFAVHPLNGQAVYWVAGRNELLFAVFALASWLTFVKALDTRRPGWQLGHGLAVLLALLSKETAVVLPLVLALHVWTVRGRPRELLSGPFPLVAWAGAVLVWFGLRVNALGWPRGPGEIQAAAVTLLRNLPELAAALGKLLVPARLNVAPGVDTLNLALGAVAALSLAILFSRRLPWRTQLFVWGWFVLCFLPSLVVPGMPAYEHRAYVPAMGILAGVALVASPERSGGAGAAGRAATAAVVVVLAALTFTRSHVFADPFQYWQDAARDPTFGPVAHVNLGQLLEQVDRLDEAEGHYRQALALDPRTPGANNDLGVVLMKRGQPDEALALFERELASHPENADAWFNLGLAFARRGDTGRAIATWERVVKANRYYLPAYRQLAEAYRSRGDAARASRYDAAADALERPRR